jgi:hypothetical protein
MTLNLPQVPFILFIDQQIESCTWKSSHNVKNPTEHVMKGTTTPTIFIGGQNLPQTELKYQERYPSNAGLKKSCGLKS